MGTVLRAVPGSVGRCVRPGFDRQEIPVEISLMGQIQAFLANVERLILRAVDGCEIELDGDRLLIHKTQRALQLDHLATALIQTVISISFLLGCLLYTCGIFPPAVKIVLYSQKIEHPAH
jgi:hypothetical protein